MKLESVTEEGDVYFNIVGTNIRMHQDESTNEVMYCANFDKCIPDEEDLYYIRYRYLLDYTKDSRDVLNEIEHYMEWFIGYSRNSIELAEIRTSYMLALDGKV